MIGHLKRREDWLKEGWSYIRRDFLRAKEAEQVAVNRSNYSEQDAVMGISDDDDFCVEVKKAGGCNEDELTVWMKFTVPSWTHEIERSGTKLADNQKITLMMLWKHVDILDWWRRHETMFPTIARLARRYLACPAAQSFQERVFSGAKVVMNAKRTNLKAKTFEQLTILRHNKVWLDERREAEKAKVKRSGMVEVEKE